MKKGNNHHKLFLILFIIHLLSLPISSSQKNLKLNITNNSNTTSNLKKNLNNRNSNSSSTKTSTTSEAKRENPYKNMNILNDPNVDPKNLPFNIKGKYVNSFGIKINDPTELTKPPFKISRCDQYVSFSSDYIPDLKDYLYRETGFVVINSYYTHLFKKNKKDLIGSVLLPQSAVAPMEPRGAKDCIQIDGGGISKNIILCFKDKKLKENIMSVLDEFSSCRASNKQTDEEKKKIRIHKLKEDCPLLNSKENPQDLIDRYNKNKEKRELSEKYSENEIWHPAPVMVPGFE